MGYLIKRMPGHSMLSKVTKMETIIFMLMGLFALSADARPTELLTRTQVMMGTYVSISLPEEQISASSLAFERLKEVEMALSSYNSRAEIYRLNRDHEVAISRDTYEALKLCTRYYKETQGFFDITIGSITKGLFHFGEEESVPSEEELKKARVNFQGLHFNEKKAWTDKGVMIDLGGMGKGFGVEKATDILREQGVKEGIVSLSGDIFCLHECDMAIQHPFDKGELATFSMAQRNTGISTSGNYRRYVISSDYNHLINPKTRHSQRVFASITLISDSVSNSDLDAYATATSVMPKEKALTFLDDMSMIGYLVVTNEKKLYINEKFKNLTKKLKLYPISSLEKKEYIRVPPLRPQSSKMRGL